MGALLQRATAADRPALSSAVELWGKSRAMEGTTEDRFKVGALEVVDAARGVSRPMAVRGARSPLWILMR